MQVVGRLQCAAHHSSVTPLLTALTVFLWTVIKVYLIFEAMMVPGCLIFRQSTLESFRWRVDVAISSGSLKRLLEPSVLMAIETSDGKEHCFEVRSDLRPSITWQNMFGIFDIGFKARISWAEIFCSQCPEADAATWEAVCVTNEMILTEFQTFCAIVYTL